MIKLKPREIVAKRSEGMCEAMALVGTSGIYSRCWGRPIEVHHLLTRARGGRILDDVGETHHLIALCSNHHSMADGEEAYEGNLLIDGYVRTVNGKPFYVGSDVVLKERYGRR